MDAIASMGLAIGLALSVLRFVLVAVLSFKGLREGREMNLSTKNPSLSLKLGVPPREIPETQAPPQGTGWADEQKSADDLHCCARARMNLKDKFDNQQQVDSREK